MGSESTTFTSYIAEFSIRSQTFFFLLGREDIARSSRAVVGAFLGKVSIGEYK